MLKINEQENLITIFFVVIILLVSIYAVIDKNVIDVIYLGVTIYYFIKFLFVRFKKC